LRATAAADRSAGDVRSRLGGSRRSHDRRRRLSLNRRARGAAVPRRRSAATSSSPAGRVAPLAVIIGLLFLLGAFASPASALETHPYTGVAFGPDGIGGSASFEMAGSVAVDPGSGEVYVYDVGAGKVYKFDAAGAPMNFSATGTNAISDVGSGGSAAEYQVAVAPAGSPGGTAGDIYVVNAGKAVHVYSAAGTELAVLEQDGIEACGVAADPSGNFYAGVYPSTINKYTPTANPPKETDKVGSGTAEVGLCNVAADGLGNVYAAKYTGGIYKLEGLADSTPTPIDSDAGTMAIAPGSNDLYADRSNEILRYDSSGALIGSFGGGEISKSRGVAVNTGASKVYVDTPSKVKIFGPWTTVPDATTEAADAITKTTAQLHGTIGAAGGPDATCVFQYVAEVAYFSTGFEGAGEVPCNPAGPFTGSGTTAVSATATGLSAKSGYYFRLLGTSANGSSSGQALLFTTPGAVNVKTDPAGNVTDSGATLNGTINPEGVELEECSFEYRLSVNPFFRSAPCAETPAAIGSGNSPVPVHLDLSELRAGTEYVFRLAATNDLGSSQGSEKAFKTKGPTVAQESTAGVSETATTFKVTINPNGFATSFVFEYLPQQAFEQNGYAGAIIVPAGGESLGAGTAPVEGSAQVNELAPGTTYRVRVVATSADGVAHGSGFSFTTRAPALAFGPCPNDDFRSGFGALLPDCRAYEQVTPTDKGGLDIEGFADQLGAAPDGSSVSFGSTSGSGAPVGGGGRQDLTALLSSRVGESWVTQRLLPPETLGEKAEYLGSSQDMRYALVEAGDFKKAALFLIDTSDESVTEVVPYQNEQSVQFGAFHFDSISKDGARLFFESQVKLTPEAVAGAPNLYMWDRASGEVSTVGLLPQSDGGGSPPGGSFGAGYAAYLGGSSAGQYVDAIHAASPDGDQIYFTAADTLQLYLRLGLAGPTPSTVHVSAPEAGVNDPNGPLPASFQEATPDGGRAFFLSSEKLTADASTGGSDGGKDLYRYDRADDTLVDVTAGQEGPANPNGAEVLGLLGASSDGSTGYFAARGKLTPEAAAGAENIYRFQEEDDGGFTFVFVGEGEPRDWVSSSYGAATIGGYIGKTARVSPDGGTLVYRAENQIFIYRAGDEGSTCISCDPGGTTPVGASELTAGFFNSNFFVPPNAGLAGRLTRNISADGSRVFFQTPNALLAADTNGTPECKKLITSPAVTHEPYFPMCTDVYEWEAVGAPGGSCTKVEFNGGCLYLLSTGKSEDASYFIDASSDGSSVFIGTTSQLVPSDRDQLYDIYDVRVDGGLASQQFVPSAPCEGGACRAIGTSAPAAQTAGSATFNGPGNVKPKKHKRCKKGTRKCHKKKHKHKKNHHGQGRSGKGDRK